MQFSVKSGTPEKQRSACLVIGIFEARRHNDALSDNAKTLDKGAKGYITNILKQGLFGGKVGQHLLLPQVPKLLTGRVLLIGCGKKQDIGLSQFRKIIHHTTQVLSNLNINEAVSYLSNLPIKGRGLAWKLEQAVAITHGSSYRFESLKSEKKTASKLKHITFGIPTRKDLAIGEKAIEQASAIAHGVSLAKDLCMLPGNICTPTYLAEQAQAIAKSHAKVTAKILNEPEMKKLGMGALLSVSQGSKQNAKFIILNYKGTKTDKKPVVLVGKGITFDTGGINLKPTGSIAGMKFDMGGAASVLGALKAVAKLNIPLNVIGVIASAENMPGSQASRPDDVVTSMSGQTIEIENTDAEGRLVLCDALTYTERFNPRSVIDIATLTGACVVALGAHASGLYSNHQPLANDLINAGEYCGDRAWQMPLWDEYQPQIDSLVADIKNSGGRSAGSITAACFLSRFTKKYHWAHLDVAGTAMPSGAFFGKDDMATGRPVPLLVQYLLDLA